MSLSYFPEKEGKEREEIEEKEPWPHG